MRHYLLLTAAALALGVAGGACAQSAVGTAVNVSVGPILQKKEVDYGARELSGIRKDLQDSVQSALKHSRTAPPVRVDLVIEDAVPNRPTFEQLGRTVGLSLRSVGLGGARISGMVTYADGARLPVREQFFETDLREERAVATWSDANQAFDQVAYDIGHGKFSGKYQGPGPSGSGHFGYPFTDR